MNWQEALLDVKEGRGFSQEDRSIQDERSFGSIKTLLPLYTTPTLPYGAQVKSYIKQADPSPKSAIEGFNEPVPESRGMGFFKCHTNQSMAR